MKTAPAQAWNVSGNLGEARVTWWPFLPSDPAPAWTGKANRHAQFGYGLNHLIDIAYAGIVDEEATPARTDDCEVSPGA